MKTPAKDYQQKKATGDLQTVILTSKRQQKQMNLIPGLIKTKLKIMQAMTKKYNPVMTQAQK